MISECSKLAQKEYKSRHDWVGKVIPWEMCKKFKFDHTNKWYIHNPVPVLENDTHKLLWGFNIQTDHLILARRPCLIITKKKKKKRICKILDFAVPADHRIKLKECEKKDKYLVLARELKNLWNMKVTIVPFVIGAFGTITKGLSKGLEDWEVGAWVETIQMTALPRTARILRRVLEICCHSNSSEKPSDNHHHHHHHVVPPAQVDVLTLSRHFSLSFMASGRSSGLRPVYSQSCCMYVRAGRLVFARPYEGVHKSTSLMSLSLLFQQCPACLDRLNWIVFVMGGWWLYSWCLVGCCLQDLFYIARSILV